MCIRTMTIAATLIAAVGCTDRYEIAQDKEGRTVRLDKRTGEVAVLTDGRLVVAKSEQQLAAENQEKGNKDRTLSEPKMWPAQDFKNIGVDTGTLYTAWRDGMLRYQLQLTPIPKGFDQSYSPSPLTLKLSDSAGFVVVEVEFKRADLLHVVDDQGKRYALSANASVRCSRENYESLTSWSLSWRF